MPRILVGIPAFIVGALAGTYALVAQRYWQQRAEELRYGSL